MPIKNCLLCDDLLITSEEKIYGSHYHCANDKRSKETHFRHFDDNVSHNPIKSIIAIGIFNSLVFFLFMIVMMLA